MSRYIIEDNSTCPHTFDVVEDLVGKNVTEADALEWPCELRIFWVDLLPLVNLVRFLLSYGTSFIVICGVFFNVLSFLVLTSKHMRNNTSSLNLAFLAVYDTCTLIFNFMIGVIRGNSEAANSNFHNSESLCTFHGVVVELFNLLSVWIIVSFTVERFVMIKFPLKARSWSPKKTVITLIVVSVVVTLISLHKIFVSGFEGDSVFGYKGCRTRIRIYRQIMYLYVALNTWLPAVTIVTLNGIIIRELKKNQRIRRQISQTSRIKVDEKATRLLLLVSSTFVILVLPVGIVQSVELIWNGSYVVKPGHEDYIHYMSIKLRLKWVRSFFFFLYQLTFVVNFFLYVSYSPSRFRANLRNLLGLKDKETPERMQVINPANVDDISEGSGTGSFNRESTHL